MERKNNLIAILVVVVTYLVGIAGFLWPVSQPLFLWLVPFHLLLVFGLILWQHQEWNKQFFVFLVSCYVISFISELIGIQTSMLFGHYNYGEVLGIKFFGTPLMIGINWLLLSYCTFSISSFVLKNKWLVVFFSALLLVGIDYLIEPVAIKYGFWYWHSANIPMYNYTCWFMLSLVVSSIATYCKIGVNFSLASVVYIMQAAFFVFLH